jgi:hypothetical protein
MVEVLVIAGLVVAAALAREASRRRALRAARARAQAVLDELAAAACAALADGRDPSTSRRAARAVERYGTARDRVAAATTRRELDRVVRGHRVRTGAILLATRGLERTRDLLAEAIPARGSR